MRSRDFMTKPAIRKYLSTEQLVLNEICKNESKGISRKELESKLEIHRNTITGRLNTLEREGFIISDTKGRIKIFYPAFPELPKKLLPAFKNLETAYTDIIKHITKKRLKELERKE